MRELYREYKKDLMVLLAADVYSNKDQKTKDQGMFLLNLELY